MALPDPEHEWRQKAKGAEKRIAELEADNKALSKECGKFSDRNTVALRKRAEKADLECDLLQAALTSREEQLEWMSNDSNEVMAQRDAALDAFREYGCHKHNNPKTGFQCRWTRWEGPCDCGYKEVRKAVLPDA